MLAATINGTREDLARLKALREEAAATLAECDRMIPALEAVLALAPEPVQEAPRPCTLRKLHGCGVLRQVLLDFAAREPEFGIRELMPFVRERLPDVRRATVQVQLARLAHDGDLRRVDLGRYVMGTAPTANENGGLFAADPESVAEEVAA